MSAVTQNFVYIVKGKKKDASELPKITLKLPDTMQNMIDEYLSRDDK